MKSLNTFINEALNPKYFSKDEIEACAEELTLALESDGYMAVARKIEDGASIDIYKANERKFTFKNLIASIPAKDYIDWGPNENLKSKLEKKIFDVLEKYKKK